MLTRILQEEIERSGPISFREFQNTALYHPQHGYYRRDRDPFGIHGDFYTAEQMQPVFGLLIGRIIAQLASRLSPPAPFQVVELGAGRCEMKPYLEQWNYTAIDSGFGQLPDSIRGVVFANEFFDALPVYLARKHGSRFNEVCVGWKDGVFQFVEETHPVCDQLEAYLLQHAQDAQEGWLIEAHLDAAAWLSTLGQRLCEGFLLVIDYGFNDRERIRFPEGTLMSYWRHQAMEDVLTAPGHRDITTHVPFTAIVREAEAQGFHAHRIESLAQLLLRAGASDLFEQVLDADTERERQARRQQLKTLLYGMGETFRVVLLERVKK